MEISKKQIEEIEKFVSLKLNSLDWYHTLEVRQIALKLARLEKADKEIVDVACLFHDLGKSKKFSQHAEIGAELARKYLEKNNFDQRFVEEVVYCMIVHSLPWDNKSNLVNTPEAKVLFDADMIHNITRFGVIKQSIDFRNEIQKDFRAGLIFSRDKLFKAYNLIITDNGHKMAEEGYKFIKEYYGKLIK